MDAFVAIETEGRWTRGATVVDLDGRLGRAPNARVATDLDVDALLGPGRRRGRAAGALTVAPARARAAARVRRQRRRARARDPRRAAARALRRADARDLHDDHRRRARRDRDRRRGSAAARRTASPARPLLALLLAGGGLLALLTVPLVRVLGEAFEGAGTASAMALALFALLPAATVLSAVTPVVVKLELGDLAASGTVVGRLSGWATAGALAGTFATGFVLVPLLPVRATVIGIGALLVLAGLAVGLLFRALPGGTALAVAGAAALLAAVAAVSGSRCATESVYFCANVVDRSGTAGGPHARARRPAPLLRRPRRPAPPRVRLHALDGRRDRRAAPARRRRSTRSSSAAAGSRSRATSRRPGPARARACSRSTGQLVDLARDRARAAHRPGPAGRGRRRARHAARRARRVRRPRGRRRVRRAARSRGTSPRREFAADVRRVLRPDGIYLLNVIDFGDLDLVRAEAATLLGVFADVRLVARPGPAGGNLVLIASPRRLPAAVASRSRGARTLDRAAVGRFAGDAAALTDDDAPVDQLLTAGT